jgi:hypothetical protein
LYPHAQAQHILNSAVLRLDKLVEEAFIELLPVPKPARLFLPSLQSKALPCSGLQGKHMRAGIQVAVFVLHGLLGKTVNGQWVKTPRKDDYLEEMGVALLTAYSKLKRYNCAHGHTEDTLKELQGLLLRCHALLRDANTFLEDGPALRMVLDDKSSGQWLIPKTWMAFMAAAPPHNFVAQWIEWLGSVSSQSTEWGECSLQSTNQSARSSNRNKDTLVAQIAVTEALKTVSARNLAALGLTPAPAGLGTANTAMQVAVRDQTATFPGKSINFQLSELTQPAASRTRAMNECLRLRDLSSLVHMLQTHTGAPVDLASKVEVVNFGIIMGTVLHHAGTDRYSYQPVYSASRFRGRQRFSWVAVVGATTPGIELYGRVELLFRYKGVKYAYLKYVAPVTDKKLLGGALLNTPGCGLYTWDGEYGVVEFDEATIIRREVFFPDVSDLFVTDKKRKRKVAAEGADAANKRRKGKGPAKPTNDKKKKKKKSRFTWASSDEDSSEEDDADEDDAAAFAAQDTDADDDSSSDAGNEDGAGEDAGDGDDGDAPHRQAAPEPEAGDATARFIRGTPFIWGFDGGRPTHDVVDK